MQRMLYPATRAVEHATALPGLRPRRLFGVLWPLLQVETTADMYDHQQYEIIDHFVTRSVAEGAIVAPARIAQFLNLPETVVRRCLRYLATIGHVTLDTADTVTLTDLGQRSAQAGIRYVATTSRQTILVDRMTGAPLPRTHYDDSVTILDDPTDAEDRRADRTTFLRLFPTAAWDPHVVTRLEQRPDRGDYNLPSQLRNLRLEGVRDGFLPVYLIETDDNEVLVYSGVAGHRDGFMEDVVERTALEHLIQAEGLPDPERIWSKWLTETPAHRNGRLHQPQPGRWQAILPPSAFGDPPKIPLTRIGGYQFRHHTFLHVWCTDHGTRRKALLARSAGLATTRDITTSADLRQRLDALAASLAVPPITLAELREHARATGDTACLHRLEQLA